MPNLTFCTLRKTKMAAWNLFVICIVNRIERISWFNEFINLRKLWGKIEETFFQFSIFVIPIIVLLQTPKVSFLIFIHYSWMCLFMTLNKCIFMTVCSFKNMCSLFTAQHHSQKRKIKTVCCF